MLKLKNQTGWKRKWRSKIKYDKFKWCYNSKQYFSLISSKKMIYNIIYLNNVKVNLIKTDRSIENDFYEHKTIKIRFFLLRHRIINVLLLNQ